MRIAIPVTKGKLSAHFGHCRQFFLADADPECKMIMTTKTLKPPVHEPGVLPRWLHEQGAEIIIAGGMGQRAKQLFSELNITVVTGALCEDPDRIVQWFLSGDLRTGANVCDH